MTAWIALAIAAPDAYRLEVEAWRKEMDASLRRPEGWLAVSALAWLREGVNLVGSSPEAAVKLPKGAPAVAGALHVREKEVKFKAAKAEVLVDGKPEREATLNSDRQGRPSRVKVGDLTFVILERGGRLAVRLWNPNSINRLSFQGRKWFPIDARFRVEADFRPYAHPKTAPILDVLGNTNHVTVPGYAEFTLAGKKMRLVAEQSGDALFFNFRDGTSGKETYPAGRFLYADAPKNGKVILDFNRAYSPPCAFTAYATCPLPPPENVLRVRIPAGEKWSGKLPRP
jgi:uncharacterized protein (DUF1684 family)